MSTNKRLQNNGEESVGSLNMPAHPAPTEVVNPLPGSPTHGLPTHSGLLCPRAYSPSSAQRFSPYGVPLAPGVASPGTPTEQSGVVRGMRRSYVPTLAKHEARLSERISATTIPILVQVAQISETMQQIGALAGHALEAVQEGKKSTKQLKGEVTEVLHAYMQQTEVST